MRFRLALLFLSLFTFISCGKLAELPTDPGVGGGPIDPTATFTRVQNEVFTPTCTTLGCHGAIAAQEQLILTADRSFGLIVGVRSNQNPSLFRIAPGDPANSYVYRKITGSGITGDRMPQTGPILSDAKIALIRDWIRRGAPND